MIFPVIYAVVVWWMAMHWRRRWPSFAAVGLGVLLPMGGYVLLRRWDGAISPMYRHVLILFWPYVVLLAMMGFYIAMLPRRAGAHQCARCFYDLRGLSPSGLNCPECGEPFMGKGSGREPPEPTLIPIPSGPPRQRTVL